MSAPTDEQLEHALERCKVAGAPAYAELAANEVLRLRIAMEVTREAARKIEAKSQRVGEAASALLDALLDELIDGEDLQVKALALRAVLDGAA